MITDQEKSTIIELAKKYGASSVFLFGSSIEIGHEHRDIDIGVEGVVSHRFFNLYSELFKFLPKPVDLVDLDRKSKINDIIKKNSIKIYG